MKRWWVPCLAVVVMIISGCSTPSDPDPVVPTATPVPTHAAVATATATPTTGTIGVATATFTPTTVVGGPTATPSPTPSGMTYSVKYEVIATNTDSVQFTYLDNSDAYPTNITSGTWTTTVTMNSGYTAQVVCSYIGTVGTPTVTVNIYVDLVLQATETRSGIVPAFTTEYVLP